MFAILKSTAAKLIVGGLALVGGYEGMKWYRGKNASYTLQPMHDYAVVLSYTGQGAGGPLSSAQIQGYLASADTAAGAVGVVMSTATDEAKKLVTYRLGMATALAPLQVHAASLIGPTVPAAYGKVSVVSVTDLGASQGAAA